MAPGVTTFGTGSHTSVSSGFILVDCCAEITVAAANRAASAMDLENCTFVILDEDTSYSARKASSGEIKLARKAGIKEAANVANPSAKTAADVSRGLNGSMP